MEHLIKEKAGKKDVHWTRKRPYAKPTLTVHGDVEEITRVLRLKGGKGFTVSGDDFIRQ
jgi:hypothetical protein